MSDLTQKQLKELFYYSPDDGVFIRKVKTANCVNIGDIIGCNAVLTGYASISINNKNYLAHRLVWLYVTGEWPKNYIDHINHIRNDNRFINLREATRQENSKNTSISNRNTSGVTGVHFAKRENKWCSKLMINGKDVFIGHFIDKFEAICARKSANNKYGFHENHGAVK